MKKTLLYFLFSVLISTSLFSQSDFREGYIVTLQNDTIYGEIDLRSNVRNANSCVFRTNSELKTYSPKEIRMYRIVGEKYYVSKKIKLEEVEESVFLEFLVEGIANLFYLKKSSDEYFIIEKEGRLVPLTNKEFLLQGEDGSVFAKESDKFRGVMLYYFRDAPQLANKIRQTEFNYKGLVNITQDYHGAVCSDYECIEYVKSTESSVFIEAVGGYVINKMSLKSSSESLSSNSPIIGVNFVFKPSKSHYVWNIILGMSYYKSNFVKRIDDYDEIENLFLDLDVNYDVVKVPLKVRYEFPGNKIQPFLSAGIINSVLLNNNSSIVNQRSVRTQREEDAKMENYQFGYCASLGFKYKISDRNYLIFEAEYGSRRPRTRSYKILNDHNVSLMLFSVGYAFKL